MFQTYTPTADAATLNLLVYGPSGVGKTTLAGSAAAHPDLSPVLFLNIEGGLLSVVGKPGVLAADIRSTADLEDAFWSLKKSLDDGKPIARTVVIDSGTEAQTLSLEEAAVRAHKKKPRADTDERYLEDYGRSTAQLSRIFRWFRDLPVHTVITALPKEIVAADSGVVRECMPSFTTKLGRSVMGFVDCVWYLGLTPGGKRAMVTVPQGVYVGKTRGARFAEALGPVVRGDAIDLAKIYTTFKETHA